MQAKFKSFGQRPLPSIPIPGYQPLNFNWMGGVGGGLASFGGGGGRGGSQAGQYAQGKIPSFGAGGGG